MLWPFKHWSPPLVEGQNEEPIKAKYRDENRKKDYRDILYYLSSIKQADEDYADHLNDIWYPGCGHPM